MHPILLEAGPITIYSYAGSPYEDWVSLAWVGALITTLSVLGLNVLARSVLGAKR